MSEPMPPYPATPLAASAAAHHELYRTYVAAGFTPDQAMQVLLTLVAAGMAKSS